MAVERARMPAGAGTRARVRAGVRRCETRWLRVRSGSTEAPTIESGRIISCIHQPHSSLSLPIATRDGRPLRLAAGAPPVALPLLTPCSPSLLNVLDALCSPRLDALEVEGHPAALCRDVGALGFLRRRPFVFRSGQGRMRGRTGPGGLHGCDWGKADQAVGVRRGAELRDEPGSEVVRLRCHTTVLLRGWYIMCGHVYRPFSELAAKFAAAARTRLLRTRRALVVGCMRRRTGPASLAQVCRVRRRPSWSSPLVPGSPQIPRTLTSWPALFHVGLSLGPSLSMSPARTILTGSGSGRLT